MNKALYGKFLIIGIILCLGLAGIVPAAEKTNTTEEQIISPVDFTEIINIDWPVNPEWKVGFSSENEKGKTQLFYPDGQSSGNWEEMITVEQVYGPVKTPLTGIARTIMLGTKQACPDVKYEIIDKKLADVDVPSILFSLQCPQYTVEQPPETQFWRMFAGQTALFSVQYSYRGDSMPKDRKEEILDFIKSITVEKKKIESDGENNEEE